MERKDTQKQLRKAGGREAKWHTYTAQQSQDPRSSMHMYQMYNQVMIIKLKIKQL